MLTGGQFALCPALNESPDYSWRSHVFLKLSTGQVMDFYWIVGSDKYFHKLLEQAKKTGAPLLGLAKSIS